MLIEFQTIITPNRSSSIFVMRHDIIIVQTAKLLCNSIGRKVIFLIKLNLNTEFIYHLFINLFLVLS